MTMPPPHINHVLRAVLALPMTDLVHKEQAIRAALDAGHLDALELCAIRAQWELSVRTPFPDVRVRG